MKKDTTKIYITCDLEKLKDYGFHHETTFWDRWVYARPKHYALDLVVMSKDKRLQFVHFTGSVIALYTQMVLDGIIKIEKGDDPNGN